jgi:3-deoxy-D-arabino-heptulosonate 7-phosphate (DAHP) synthase class II
MSRALAAAAALLLALHAVCLAQSAGTPIVGTPRVDPAAARIRDEQQRQMALRSGGRRGEDAHVDEKTVKAAAEQLNDDFKRVQVIRNDLARAVTSGGALDFKHVSEEAAEVRKRSLRMQTYLALREEAEASKQHEEADADAPDEKQLRDSLVQLCHRIDSFVANPRFKSPDVVNVDANAKAARDLREIIALSRRIKGGAERLGRGDK